MIIQSTSSALVATSRIKFQGFRRGLASRNQPAKSSPPTATPVHVYAQQQKKPQIAITNIPLEPRPTKLPPLSRTWKFLTPNSTTTAKPAAHPHLSSWSRSHHSQMPSALPAILPPTLPARSIQREQLRPLPLMIRKDSGRLGSRSSYSAPIKEGVIAGKELMTKCVYVPWLLRGDSAESAEWNAFLAGSLGHYHCQTLHG